MLPRSKLFISHRREDSADIYGRLDDKLAAHFGRNNIWEASKGGWDPEERATQYEVRLRREAIHELGVPDERRAVKGGRACRPTLGHTLAECAPLHGWTALKRTGCGDISPG
jgi:hypothetical protein